MMTQTTPVYTVYCLLPHTWCIQTTVSSILTTATHSFCNLFMYLSFRWKYRISLNRHHPWMVAAQLEALSEINVVLNSSRSSCTWHMQMISDDGHQASTRAVCVVWLISAADSRTERLCVLLTASNSRHCIAHTCLIEPSLMSVEFPGIKSPPLNRSCTKQAAKKIVAAASDRRNLVT